jgi:hypothetical protein
VSVSVTGRRQSIASSGAIAVVIGCRVAISNGFSLLPGVSMCFLPPCLLKADNKL